jgi:hypothetical protein
MPVLRKGEKMQRCETSFHEQIRRQKYYIKRTYYNELEQHFCPGCCNLLEARGLLKYSVGDGYMPTGDLTFETLLKYGKELGVANGR